MKSKIVFILLLSAMFFVPGCYTILLVEQDTASDTSEVAPAPQPAVEYIPVYYPGTIPEHMPHTQQYIAAPTYSSDSPHAPSAPPSSNEQRPTQTGRGSVTPSPAPAKPNDTSTGTRDSGTQRSKR